MPNYVKEGEKNHIYSFPLLPPSLPPQVYCHFKTITGQVLYDTIQDSDYRTQWDEALIDDRTICLVEDTDSDLCYYSSEQCTIIQVVHGGQKFNRIESTEKILFK